MPISDEIINEIKYRNDIESVISPYVTLKRAGKNLTGLCPFHNEKTPSFTVYPETASFYCFGCGVGGDIFTFTKLIENLDYVEAVKLLAERSGISVAEDSYDNSIQEMKRKIYEINRESAKFFHNYIMSPKGKWALDYLCGRGLTVATIKHFGLGCAPDEWDALTKHLLSLGYSADELIAADVSSRSGKGTVYDRFRHRVMFPIINLRGNVIAFSGRKDPKNEEEKRKFVNTSDTLVFKKSENLFGINFAKNSCAERVILVEGNMDVVSLHQAGFTNTVAALGTSFTEEQAKLLSRYSKEIVVCLDADEAGQKAVRRAIEILKKTGINIRVVVVPDGKDPDEYIKNNSADRFRMLLDGAVNDIDYKLNSAAKSIDPENVDSTSKFLRKASEILAATDDAITVDLYVNKLSAQFGVQRRTLEENIARLKKETARRENKKQVDAVIHPRFDRNAVNPDKLNNKKAAMAEEAIISILLKHNDFYENVRGALSREDFVTPLNARIFARIFDILSDGGDVDVSSFGSSFSPAETGYIVSLQHSIIGDKNPLKVLDDSIRVLKEEKNLKSIADTKGEELTDEEWLNQMNFIINNKKEIMPDGKEK